MVLLDLLHIQRAGFFKFLRSGLNEELSQLNVNIENTRLEILPFTPPFDNESSTDRPLTLTKTYKTVSSSPYIPLVPEGKEDAYLRSLPIPSHRIASLKANEGIPLVPKGEERRRTKANEGEQRGIPSFFTFGTRKHFFAPWLTPFGDTTTKGDGDAMEPKVKAIPQKNIQNILSLRTRTPSPSVTPSFTFDGRTTSPWVPSVPEGFHPVASTTGDVLEYLRSPSFAFGDAMEPKVKNKGGKPKGEVQRESSKVKSKAFSKQRGISKDSSPPFTHTFKEGKAFNKQSQKQSDIFTGKENESKQTNITKNACFSLIAPKYTPREAILYQKSWSCKLVVKVSLTVQGLEQPVESPSLPRRGTSSPPSGKPKGESLCLPEGSKEVIGTDKKVLPEIKSLATPSLPKGEQNDHELFLVLGELPLMTKRGHFIINGSPRVILSQLIRTPGIYFTERDNELQADCIPEQGPWLCISKNSKPSVESQKESLPLTPRAPSLPVSSPSPDEELVVVPPKGVNQGAKECIVTRQPGGAKKVTNIPGTFGSGITDPIRGELSLSSPLPQVKLVTANYFCYTKQFSSMPFSLIYSNFRTFELHAQFTDQTLLLTKLKTLEKIRQLRELITTLLTFTWKKRTRKRLQKLYTKRCFTATQQFEKTKIIFRLKRKLILGFLGRKSFNEKLAISNCENIASTFLPYGISVPRTWSPSPLVTDSEAKNTVAFASPKEYSLSLPAGPAGDGVKTLMHGMHTPSPSPLVTANERGKEGVKKGVTEGEGVKDSSLLLGTPFYQSGETGYEWMHNGLSRNIKPLIDSSPPVRAPSPKTIEVKKTRTRSKNILTLNSSNNKELVLSEGEPTLLSQDLALIIRFLDSYKIMPKDDIDDLNNQRVRTSSDQIQQQIRVGCLRFKKMFIKLVRESWGVSQTITDLLNGALREFFGSNPLSQFLDQTNSLAEITHKRRISKLGLGGIQRESATLKVRTIHSTYFGRICPIETPEGVNAGLVNSLTCLSRVNEQGQLVTPVSPLIEKQLQNQFFHYSNRDKRAISTTDTALLKFQRLPNQFIYTKNESHFEQLEVHKVHLRVQSDLQTISLATALIPFLPYDDANRALMGSNMQRQAVPLILPERPMIRTGLESLVISESGHSKESPMGGFVSYVSAQFVIITCHVLNKRTLSF